VNALATVATGGAAGGACDKLTRPNLFTNHVKVLPKEITKTATPLTGNIRTAAEGIEFQVPVGEVASWRVTVVVTNPNLSETRGVTVSDNFGGEFAVTGITPSQGTVQTTLSGVAQKVHLEWTVGTIPAGGTARLQLVASTKLNPAGRQEYTSPGVYQLNSGATVKYALATGGQCSATSNTIQVTAVSTGATSLSVLSAPSSLSIQSLQVKPLATGSSNRYDATTATIPFTEEFQPLSPAIAYKSAQYGYDAGFEVPENLRLQWRVVLTVKNTLADALSNVTVTERFGAELEVDDGSIEVAPAPPRSSVTVERQGNEKLGWLISRLGPGEEAQLKLTVYTRLKDGKQAYISCTPPPGPPNLLNSGATLKYLHGSLELPKIPVWVKSGGYLRVSLSATRYDWQIRKPGGLMADPLEISVYANQPVTVTFSGFDDLASLPTGSERIPTFYRFCDARPGTSLTNWVRAADLNNWQQATTTAEVGTTVAWKLWPRLDIGPAIRAGDYEDVATLTFLLTEAYPQVVPSGAALQLTSLEEVKQLTTSGFTFPAR
jgi:hypothetical protein